MTDVALEILNMCSISNKGKANVTKNSTEQD